MKSQSTVTLSLLRTQISTPVLEPFLFLDTLCERKERGGGKGGIQTKKKKNQPPTVGKVKFLLQKESAPLSCSEEATHKSTALVTEYRRRRRMHLDFNLKVSDDK